MIAELAVDLGAIRRNVRALAALSAPSAVVPVLKANAYGHGLVPVARALAADVRRFAVYELDEALELRAAGITTPLHVLGPVPPARLPEAHAADAILTLWDDGAYRRDVAVAAARAGKPFPVHAKVDTGVVRLGMDAARAPALLASYASSSDVRLDGVYSHLAAAEELDSTFTEEQLARFHAATGALAPSVERHIAATAAAMLWPQTRLDSVRTGIGCYGLWPSPETEAVMRARGFALEPALTWRTQIVALHDVPAHTPVGYGCAYHTKRPSRIGVLPIGYAEGLPRHAGDRATVAVAGARARIVGRVCMNMAFVDCTDIAAARPGATVTLIGRDGDLRLGADALASALDTIAYEVVARLPAAMPRVYDDQTAPTVRSPGAATVTLRPPRFAS